MKAAKLLTLVMEKEKAEGELAVPSYDNQGTPNNHVGNKNMKAVSNPAKGLGQGRDESPYPEADVGTPKRGEKRSDSNGQMDKNDAPVKKMSEGKRELSVPERHQLKIARDTLKMSDQGAMIMGGMNKEEARKVIQRLTGKTAKESGGQVNEADLHPLVQSMGLNVAGGVLTFSHPTGAGQTYKAPWTGDFQNLVSHFIQNPASREDPARAASELYARLSRTPGIQPAQARTSF